MSTTMRQAGRGIGRDIPWGLGSGGSARPDSRRGTGSGRKNRSTGGIATRLTPALGWLSLALGSPGIAMPGRFARFIGLSDDGDVRTITRLVGLREVASGVGILAQRQPIGWLWLRVAGDLMDLAILGSSFASGRSIRPVRTAWAIAAVVGVTAVDLYCAVQRGRHSSKTAGRVGKSQNVQTKKAITINRPPEEIYRFWRDFQNLPRFMRYLESVQVTDERRSHWRAQAPAGRSVEWDAEVVEDRPNELISWRSLEGADVPNAGMVRFAPAPGGRGTEIHVELRYDPPGGKVGRTVARLFGKEPGQEVESDLRRLKQILEAGEVLVSDATVEGGRIAQRPAQPPERAPQHVTASR